MPLSDDACGSRLEWVFSRGQNFHRILEYALWRFRGILTWQWDFERAQSEQLRSLQGTQRDLRLGVYRFVALTAGKLPDSTRSMSFLLYD